MLGKKNQWKKNHIKGIWVTADLKCIILFLSIAKTLFFENIKLFPKHCTVKSLFHCQITTLLLKLERLSKIRHCPAKCLLFNSFHFKKLNKKSAKTEI